MNPVDQGPESAAAAPVDEPTRESGDTPSPPRASLEEFAKGQGKPGNATKKRVLFALKAGVSV
ncbi:MAG: hypothetical protein AAFX76_04395, partial [Planctomycetota bacterium]